MAPARRVPRQPFGIGTRTELRLGHAPLLVIAVRAGDVLRGAAGTVWITVERQFDDIVLAAGRTHVVEHDARLHVSGFGAATLEIYGHDALRYWTPPGRRSIANRLEALAADRKSVV